MYLPKICKGLSYQGGGQFWKVIFFMVVVTFQKIDKVFQRYILPSFSKIYLPKAVVSSQHTCLTLATLYLPSIGPAPVNLLRSGPGLVTENHQVMGVDHFCRMMTISKSKKSLPAYPTSVRDWSSGCCQSACHRQQQFHTGAKWNMSIASRWMSATLYYLCQAWLASWLDLVGELEDFVERFFPRGLLRH